MYNMIDDFRFIFPSKKDQYINKKHADVDFNKINNEYCLHGYNGKIDSETNLHSYFNLVYKEIYNGKVCLDDPRGEENLKILRKIIYKKQSYFYDIKSFHIEVMKKYKKMGFLSFSLVAEKLKEESISDYYRKIKSSLAGFFNNMRSKKFYSDNVVGYFWVILYSHDNHPYIHVVFYVKINNFNSLLGEDIFKSWQGAVKKKSNKHSSVLFFNVDEHFRNGIALYNKDNFHELALSRNSTIINDLNGSEYFSKVSSDRYNEKKFINYIYELCKKSYFLPTGRSIGFSKAKI